MKKLDFLAYDWLVKKAQIQSAKKRTCEDRQLRKNVMLPFQKNLRTHIKICNKT